MNEPTWQQRLGATPGKLAVVAILAVMLGYVLLNQSRSDVNTIASSAPQTKSPVKRSEKSDKTEHVKAKQDSVEKRSWPEMSVAQACRSDPFARPVWYLSTLEEPVEPVRGASQTIEALSKLGPKIIVIAGEERIATIGDQEYREGDTIEGLVISEITSDGIVFTELHQ